MKRHIVMLLVVLLSMAACTTGSTGDYPEAETPDPSLLEVYSKMIPPMPERHWHIHDPTQLVKLGGYWMIGVTGKAPSRMYPCGLETWYIVPGESDWTPGQCLFAKGPAWVEEILPDNDGAYWAPGFLTPRTMYYSVSEGQGEPKDKKAVSGHRSDRRMCDRFLRSIFGSILTYRKRDGGAREW